MNFPLTSHIFRPEHCDPLYLLRQLGLGRPYCSLLESADRKHGINDFSFVAVGARDVLTVRDGRVSGSTFVLDGPVKDPLCVFDGMIGSGQEGARLMMGYIGFLSYESARFFEPLPLAPNPEIPDAVFVLPEMLLKIDHARHEVTLVMHADSPLDIAAIEKVIMASPFRDDRKDRGLSAEISKSPLTTSLLSGRQTSRNEYCASVKKAQQEILAGEAFQIVLSQEILLPGEVAPDLVYEQLRTINPSPYMYYFQTPERTIVGASPETLTRVDGRNILYRPIAGTRKRTGDEEKDRKMRAELLSDEKERCEHQMLVDLGRNDVGRVAEIGSVQVHNPFHVEQYAHVYHIVSDITGRVRADKTTLDVLRSVFPAGTLTGAPKMRAMEIIRRLEGGPRGIYGGAFGYVDLAGNCDFAITIRTMLFQNGKISLRVGAGIVKDSIPEREDDECLHKARSCLAALERARSLTTAP